MAIPKEKVSITLDKSAVRQAKQAAGNGHFSEWVNEAVLLRLQADRLQRYLVEQGITIPPEVIASVEAEWPSLD
jgi:hypothetical protein